MPNDWLPSRWRRVCRHRWLGPLACRTRSMKRSARLRRPSASRTGGRSVNWCRGKSRCAKVRSDSNRTWTLRTSSCELCVKHGLRWNAASLAEEIVTVFFFFAGTRNQRVVRCFNVWLAFMTHLIYVSSSSVAVSQWRALLFRQSKTCSCLANSEKKNKKKVNRSQKFAANGGRGVWKTFHVCCLSGGNLTTRRVLSLQTGPFVGNRRAVWCERVQDELQVSSGCSDAIKPHDVSNVWSSLRRNWMFFIDLMRCFKALPDDWNITLQLLPGQPQIQGFPTLSVTRGNSIVPSAFRQMSMYP